MTAPRLDTPELGEDLRSSTAPILGSTPASSEAVNNATNFDSGNTRLQGPGAPVQAAGSSSVEKVLGAVGGAIVTAPVAAAEAISSKISQLASGTPIADKYASTASTGDLQTQAANAASTASAKAQQAISQAATLAQQAAQKLPPTVAAYLPSSLAPANNAAPASTDGEVPSHHHELPISDSTRETTSAPLEEGATSDRPLGVMKANVAGAAPAAAAAPPLDQGGNGDDFTKPHTTGTFEAAGSLHFTHNPEIVEAQSDLATRAEAGDL